MYTGFSEKEPKERLKEHNGKSSKFTKENGPWELKYFETFYCKKCAIHREKFLKSGIGRKLRDTIIKNV